jgi:hypothetical protein
VAYHSRLILCGRDRMERSRGAQQFPGAVRVLLFRPQRKNGTGD